MTQMTQNNNKKENTQNTHYSDKKGDDVNIITESSERKINPNSLTNLTPFKKGVSGNPSGKPSNKEFKKALKKRGYLVDPEPKEIDPLFDTLDTMEKYTPVWDKRCKIEKVLDKIWVEAEKGNLSFIEYLRKWGCLEF